MGRRQTITVPESQDIILYAPRSNVFPAALMGLCLLMGLALPFWGMATLDLTRKDGD